MFSRTTDQTLSRSRPELLAISAVAHALVPILLVATPHAPRKNADVTVPLTSPVVENEVPLMFPTAKELRRLVRKPEARLPQRPPDPPEAQRDLPRDSEPEGTIAKPSEPAPSARGDDGADRRAAERDDRGKETGDREDKSSRRAAAFLDLDAPRAARRHAPVGAEPGSFESKRTGPGHDTNAGTGDGRDRLDDKRAGSRGGRGDDPQKGNWPGGDGLERRHAVDTIPPRILERPKPAYSERALSRGLEGSVDFVVVFLRSGRVSIEAQTGSLDEELDSRARKAVQAIKFEPARRRGEAVDYSTKVHVVFSLRATALEVDHV